MRKVIIIPARYESSRFPGKPLAKIKGKPLVQWVTDLCCQTFDKKDVYVATDDSRIKEFVESTGIKVIMTSASHLTGTDRVAEAAKSINADIYINVQGDEPMINPDDIHKIVLEKIKYQDDVIKGYCELSINEDPESKNIPKVVFSDNKKLIYASRSKIPGSKNDFNSKIYKAVCIYAFNKKNLDDYLNYGKKSKIEKIEDIEILRFFELDTCVRMVETTGNSLAVDVPNDIIEIENILKEN